MSLLIIHKACQSIKWIQFHLLATITYSLMISCDYHFQQPLPVDSKNIYHTPEKLKACKVKEDDYSIQFGKNYLEISDNRLKKVYNGIWFHPRDTSRTSKNDSAYWENINSIKWVESVYTIRFDSAGKAQDTIRKYVLSKDFVFELDTETNNIFQGCMYELKNDTFYLKPVIRRFFYGPDMFFRKVNSRYYLLNIHNRLIPDTPSYDWWQILLFDTTITCNEENFSTPLGDLIASKDSFFSVPRLYFSTKYFNIQLSKKETEDIINQYLNKQDEK